MSLKVAVQMDPIEGVNIEGDTSFLMMESAQARGHSLFVYLTDSLAMEFVIPAIAALHVQHPAVRVRLYVSTQMANLARREADIAIRTQKPDNPDLMVKRLSRWPMCLFASQAYLDSHGIGHQVAAALRLVALEG